VRARQAVQHRRYGEAIAHYLSAGDEAMVVQLADQLLDEYLTHGASARAHHSAHWVVQRLTTRLRLLFSETHASRHALLWRHCRAAGAALAKHRPLGVPAALL